MCTFAMRQAVQEAATDAERDKLKRHFSFKKDLVMRGEHAFYHALCKLLPELRLTEAVLDASLTAKFKSIHDARPDYFHYIKSLLKEMGLLGEYDENRDHENCDKRLRVLCDSSGCGYYGTYILRICGHHDTKRAVCERKTHGNNTYYAVTAEGHKVVSETATAITERLEWIKQGLAPDDSAGRPHKLMINF